MADDNQPEPPPPKPFVPKPFAFVRRPMFVVSLLVIAWVFLGQRFAPVAHPPVAPATSPVKPQAQPIVNEIKENDTQIATLQQRLENVESRLKTLESNPATATAAPSGDSAALNAKIAALQASLDELKQARTNESGDAAHITEALHKQEEDISALKLQLADTQAKALRRLSLMAAFDTLKDAVMRGESFAEPLTRMNELAKDDAALQPLLAQLKPYADENAPTLSLLQSQFEALIPGALAPAHPNAIARHLESMIRIRKVGEQQTGNSDEAIIARAEARLNRSDVKDTSEDLAALSSPAAAVFAAWNKKAQSYLHIRAALAALQPALTAESAPAPAAP